MMTLDQSKLLPPQREHAIKLLNSIYLNGVAIDLSDTGTGKTYVSCWIAKQINNPVFVICPKVVIDSWKNTLKEFGIDGEVINYELLVRGNTQYFQPNNKDAEYHTDYTVMIPQSSLIIMDECHKCKGYNSKNSKLMMALKDNRNKMLLLSATAATNPLEMRALGYVSKLHNLKNFRNWVLDCGAFVNQFGGLSIDVGQRECIDKMSQIHDILFNEYGVAGRMVRKQFGKYFPENQVIPDVFNMGTNTVKINKVYEEMEYELDKLEKQSENYSTHHFAVMMKARRKTELLKVPSMVEYIEDLYDEGISPVLFLNFNDSVLSLKNKINKKLHDKIGMIVGGQSAKKRKSDIEQFQSDEKRIMIVNLRAGNAGISLHDLNGKHPRHSLISPSFSAIDMLQSLGRIHRAEGKTPCVQKIMFAANTIEESACIRVRAKLNNLSVLNDNDLSPISIY